MESTPATPVQADGVGRLAAVLDALPEFALDSQVQWRRQWFSGWDYAVHSEITPESAARDRETRWSDTRPRVTR